jgi:hypothetical protein
VAFVHHPVSGMSIVPVMLCGMVFVVNMFGRRMIGVVMMGMFVRRVMMLVLSRVIMRMIVLMCGVVSGIHVCSPVRIYPTRYHA